MRQRVSVTSFSARECADEICDAPAKVNDDREDRAELYDDGIHFPKPILEADVQQGFRNPQMRGGTDGKKLGQSLHDSKQDGINGVVHGVCPRKKRSCPRRVP